VALYEGEHRSVTESRPTKRRRGGLGVDSPGAVWIFLAAWLMFLFPIYWGSARIGTIFYLALLIPVVVLWLLVNRRLRRNSQTDVSPPDRSADD
jgi:Flp pilus assembly protein TadB